MVRLLAIDIDGTLVAQEGPCSARNRMALARAREAGVEIVLVTARPWQSVVPIARECELDGMAICSLGALTYDLAACEAADSRPLSPASLADAVDTLRGLSSDIGFGWATTEAVRVEERYPARAEFEIGTLEGEAAPVVHLFARRPSSSDDWIDVAEDRLGGLVEMAQWSSGMLDITATGVTKLAALRDFCSQRGIPQASVVAIGDTMVDLPMMRWAGMGIAVGDAAQQVRDAANVVVGRCEEHAVAEAIEAVLPRG